MPYLTAKENADKHGEYVERYVNFILIFALSFVVLGIFFASLVAGCLVGTGIIAITAFSCCAVGSAIGFLFGIPKSAQNAGGIQKTNTDLDDLPRDNTNLEQISDWFVKILIGAGLVQLNAVKDMFESLAAKLCRCLLVAKHGGNLDGATYSVVDPFSQPFCLFLIFYFLTLGFLTGYLVTRVWLPYIILRSGLAMKSAQRANNAEELRAEYKTGDINLTSLQDALDALRFALSGFEGEPKKPDRPSIRLANERFENCQKIFPTHRTLTILMGRLYSAQGNYDKAIEVLNQFLAAANSTGGVSKEDVAAVLYNLACYKNRKAEQAADENETKRLRKEAWQHLKASCKDDPENAEEAQSEDDLKSLLASRPNDPLL